MTEPRTPREYGPHDPANHRPVTVLPATKWPRPVEVPLPSGLREQRRYVNEYARYLAGAGPHPVFVLRCGVCGRSEEDCRSVRPGLDDDHEFERP